MRVKNRLLNFENKIIYQDDNGFMFSLDSMLLSNFVSVRLSDKQIIDFCTGNAPVPMLLSFRTKARIFGVELQKYIYELGYDSVKENGMLNQIELINDDISNVNNLFSSDSFDVVTCNPPYFKYASNSYINAFSEKAIARHEIRLNLDLILEKAFYLLKNGGVFAMVHRPERMIEIINIMQKHKIEPKRLRFVYPKKGKAANILLIEGIKNGKSGLKVEEPLFVYDEKGNYCLEVKKMFGGDINVAG